MEIKQVTLLENKPQVVTITSWICTSEVRVQYNQRQFPGVCWWVWGLTLLRNLSKSQTGSLQNVMLQIKQTAADQTCGPWKHSWEFWAVLSHRLIADTPLITTQLAPGTLCCLQRKCMSLITLQQPLRCHVCFHSSATYLSFHTFTLITLSIKI